MSKPRRKRKAALAAQHKPKGRAGSSATVMSAGQASPPYRQFFDDSPVRSQRADLSRLLLLLGSLAIVVWIAVKL